MSTALSPEGLFSLRDQVVILTGAGTGIGRASAEAVARAGARVVLAGLAGSGVDQAAAELRGDGLAANAAECDVTDEARLAAVVAEVTEREGRIDGVVANAGAALDDGGDALAALDRMYALHVRSVVQLAALTMPIMADRQSGAFIVMSSLAGLRGNRLLDGYGVTKAANAQIVRNLAVQWGPRGVRANAVSPGVIDTAFAAPITADSEAATPRLARTPLRRFGTPAEVAGTVVWLLSPAGGFVTGQNIVVDGGTLVSD